MISLSSLFRDRLFYKIILPVIIVGLIVSFVSIRILIPPLVASLQKQTDKALYHTSDLLVSICEERFDDLIELRLDNNKQMQQAYLQEAVHQIASLNQIHPNIKTLVLKNGENLLNSNESYGELNHNSLVNTIHSSSGSIVETTILGEKVRFLGQYYPFWNLHLISFITEKDYNAPAQYARNIVVFGSFGVFSAVVITLLLAFNLRINLPLRKIISATSDVAAGNLVQTTIVGRDEIAQVGKAFNEMVQSLQDDKEQIQTILAKLRDSEEQYRILTENSLAFIAVLTDERCLFINKRLSEALGRTSDWIEKNDFFSIIHVDDRQNLREIISELSRGKIVEKNAECRLVKNNQDVIWVELQANRVMYKNAQSVLIHAMDITERKLELERREKLELQLEQAKRLEAIGTLAGGVAHDFNNMLGGIMGAAEMLALQLPENSKSLKYQKLIVKSASRAAALTEQLLTFSRTNPKTSTVIDVHNIIKETLILVKNTIDKRINLIDDFQAKKSTISGDPSQLQNMFLNLYINGAQAMPEGGDLSITTRMVNLDASYCEESGFPLQTGDYLEIIIHDTGEGIAREHLTRIFDPFFTTKTQAKGNKGTGLGLASVYGTVQQHNGAIFVSSQIDAGTTFCIQLPLTNEVVTEVLGSQEIVKGTGCILVVDDEEIMRSTAQEILENLGYEVLIAENGEQALEIYAGEKDKIDLIILDMIMPVMNGRDCFFKLRELDPSVKVALTSGFTREEDLNDMRESGLNGFIRKPYGSAAISQAISEIMAE